MKLVHKSGEITCNPEFAASYWGCTYSALGKNALMTIITNVNKECLLPPVKELKGSSGCQNKEYFYNLDGTSHKSPELVFRDLSNPLSVSRNQELQIWYGQDWMGCSEGNNSGATCVDVYAWYG